MKVKGWGRNVLLLCVLLALVGLVLQSGRQAPAPEKTLLNLEVKALDRIVIDNGEHLELNREEKGWRMTVPFQAPVSQARVDQLLEIASIIPRSEYPMPAPEALAAFGLAPPSIRLALGQSVLGFGTTAPLDRSRYMTSEGRLFLVEDRYYYALSAKPSDFVEKKLLTGHPSIRSLALPGFKLSQSAEGAWTSSPPLDEANRTALLTHWQLARAIEVRHEVHPHLIAEAIDIEVEAGAIRFLVLSKAPELILYREDLALAYVLPAEAARSLLDWRATADQEAGAPGQENQDSEEPPSHDSAPEP